MKLIMFCLALPLFSGCMFNSTGIVPIDRDIYMVAKTSPGGGFVTADRTKAVIYQEANAFCEKQGKQIETIKITAVDGRPFRAASAELQFRCVKK